MGLDFVQSAWIVRDLPKAMDHWTRTYGVGPFFVIAHAQIEGLRYRGQPSGMDYSGALAFRGAMMIELIQQHDSSPSVYNEAGNQADQFFHHICALTNDFEEHYDRFTKNNVVAAMEGRFGSTRFAYFDTGPTIGCMTELVEETVEIRSVFQLIADANANWDGRDPVRQL
ncbi:MAG: VOC family protein [Sphingomonadaceae bacterium]